MAPAHPIMRPRSSEDLVHVEPAVLVRERLDGRSDLLNAVADAEQSRLRERVGSLDLVGAPELRRRSEGLDLIPLDLAFRGPPSRTTEMDGASGAIRAEESVKATGACTKRSS